MAPPRMLRPAERSKLAFGPAIEPDDQHAQLVKADERFQAALDHAIAEGSERIAAVEATVQLKRITKLSLSAMREERLQVRRGAAKQR
jgi:hypothetical protein